MIDLYTWTTPNGRKVSILLEELGIPYEVHPVDIGKDDQFKPDFLTISPNNKIPAIVDRDTGISLMESGAILIYLAEKTGKFLPATGEPRYRVIEWLMWQMGGVGPMLGQAHHFLHFNKGKAPYAEERFRSEAKRLYGVLDRRLADRAFVADDYSIADMAIWPWIKPLRVAGDRPERVPEREALVCRDRRPAGGAEGLSRAEIRLRHPDAVSALGFRKRVTPRHRRHRRSQQVSGSMRSATSTDASTCCRSLWRRSVATSRRPAHGDRSRSFSATMSTAGRSRAKSSSG